MTDDNKTPLEKLQDWADKEIEDGLFDVKFFVNPESDCRDIQEAATVALLLLTGDAVDISHEDL